ncbi:histidine phosphatase family protein [Bacillus thuringiensis serovar pingluonsis]|uniref:Histidine phosphatase family protein n=1 Tax=Bacillus thuringiensis serovar pingluonsis TaxID=180881 RepID=A0A243BKE1_BACTU|nr:MULTISPECIES: histidine phosphatase family protein [Bacillus]MBR9654348.1 histidine phosphatase family protein [Bacillus cereus]MCU4898502.1 histidine phosphatase family protein [Bacillus cereus]MEB9683064.1 histidine phosphatase family protein [Bacillus anthracis]OKA30947.1 histidine phosphatase family protein [Bacillus cereus]OTY47607.1 histidine phosphatase family protein [Bacillus thuringiensis serovar pingluonsis]
MTTIYFVRHAHSTYTKEERERPLSEKGHCDAENVIHLLKDKHIDVVISSPYKRAIQTVQGIANTYHVSIEIEEDLRERLLSSEPVADFNDAIENVWEDWSFAYEGGESNDVAQRRAVICMQSILKKYKGKNIVIGTHGNIMVLLMNYFDSKYDFRFWKTLRMPDIFKLNFHNEDLVAAERIENTGHQINNL